MTKEAFEEMFAASRGLTVAEFRERGGIVKPCACRSSNCPKWLASQAWTNHPESACNLQVPLTLTQTALLKGWLESLHASGPALNTLMSPEGVALLALQGFLASQWEGKPSEFEALWWKDHPKAPAGMEAFAFQKKEPEEV